MRASWCRRSWGRAHVVGIAPPSRRGARREPTCSIIIAGLMFGSTAHAEGKLAECGDLVVTSDDAGAAITLTIEAERQTGRLEAVRTGDGIRALAITGGADGSQARPGGTGCRTPRHISSSVCSRQDTRRSYSAVTSSSPNHVRGRRASFIPVSCPPPGASCALKLSVTVGAQNISRQRTFASCAASARLARPSS